MILSAVFRSEVEFAMRFAATGPVDSAVCTAVILVSVTAATALIVAELKSSFDTLRIAVSAVIRHLSSGGFLSYFVRM